MYKLLFIYRTITTNGVAVAMHHVEFVYLKDADVAYEEAKSVGNPDLKIIKLYR